MKIILIKIILTAFLVLTVTCQKAEAFWKFPFEIKFGNPQNSIENNEYYQARQAALNTVSKLVSAYEQKNVSKFMNLVSEDFTLDKSNLNSAVRQDFLKYSYIGINFFVNNAVKSSDGKIAVSLNYTRNIEDRTAGKMVSGSFTTELILIKEDNVYKLYSMRKPYLFGITGI